MDRTHNTSEASARVIATIGVLLFVMAGCAPAATDGAAIDDSDLRRSCGNGTCNSRESCSTCPVDCGSCTDSGSPASDSGSAPVDSGSAPVDSGGAETCVGVAVPAGSFGQSFVNGYPAGTTFCFAAGVYRMTAPVLARSFDRYIGAPGAILDGGGVASQAIYGYGGATGQHDVTVRGLVIRAFAGPGGAVKTGWTWTVERNEIAYNGQTGVQIGQNIVLRDNNIHHNALYGLTGGPGLATNMLIANNELAYNNTSGAMSGDGGGCKLVGSTLGLTGVTWRGNWVHHNTGPGIWHDGNVGPHDRSTPPNLIENNIVEGNSGPGIFIEISWAHVIRNNTVRGNQTYDPGRSCFWGSQIHNNNSQLVEIYGNTIEADGTNAICAVDTVRDDYAPFSTTVTGCSVHDNVIRMRGISSSGLVGSEFAPYDRGDMAWDHNTYYVGNLAGTYWVWSASSALNKDGWRALGQDATSTFTSW